MDQDETPGQAPPEGEPSEEELRARIEESLRTVRVQDVLLESVATLVNLTARRIGKADERDLEQARIGIEAVRAVTDLLDEEPREQVRNALSELQMIYAREAGGGAPTPGDEPPGGQDPGSAPRQGAPDPPPPRAGDPAPGGLWTPPGS